MRQFEEKRYTLALYVFPKTIPIPSSRSPSCTASVIHTWHPELDIQSATNASSLFSYFSPPNNYSSSSSWALALGQSPGIHQTADHRMSEQRGSLRNMDLGMLINTLLYNCWWLLELSDKSYDNNSPSLAQRWFRKHIRIEEQATIFDDG